MKRMSRELTQKELWNALDTILHYIQQHPNGATDDEIIQHLAKYGLDKSESKIILNTLRYTLVDFQQRRNKQGNES